MKQTSKETPRKLLICKNGSSVVHIQEERCWSPHLKEYHQLHGSISHPSPTFPNLTHSCLPPFHPTLFCPSQACFPSSPNLVQPCPVPLPPPTSPLPSLPHNHTLNTWHAHFPSLSLYVSLIPLHSSILWQKVTLNMDVGIPLRSSAWERLHPHKHQWQWKM